MLNELEEVLNRPKFSSRISSLGTSVAEIMIGVVNLVQIVRPESEINLRADEKPIDIDDIMFVQCAVIAGADYIISGDEHLLNLTQIREISVVKPVDFLIRFSFE